MTERRVFLSYRREDSIDASFRLYDALANRFGGDHVFIDIDSIDPGRDFEEAIDEHIASCDALVVVIGQHWAELMSESRLSQRPERTKDYVVLEIEAGLQANLLVIPVLIHGALMPAPEQVPPTIAGLCRRQALECHHRSWSHDVGRLIAAIERLERSRPEQQTTAVTCPAGHRSQATDYCDRCGARITGGKRDDQGAGKTGKGSSIQASSSLDRVWEAVVTADREYFDRVAEDGIEFPQHFEPRRFVLDRPEMCIGRSSPRRAPPEIDLSGVPQDPAISSVHAILVRQADGTYSLIDPGSTNGTTIDNDPTPIAINTPVPVADGSRIRMGAWTAVTVHCATGPGSTVEGP